jgi:hypothetical protein
MSTSADKLSGSYTPFMPASQHTKKSQQGIRERILKRLVQRMCSEELDEFDLTLPTKRQQLIPQKPQISISV